MNKATTKLLHGLLGNLAAGGILELGALSSESVLAVLLGYVVTGTLPTGEAESSGLSRQAERWTKRTWKEVVEARRELQEDLELSRDGSKRLDEAVELLRELQGSSQSSAQILAALAEHQVEAARVTAQVPDEAARLVKQQREPFEEEIRDRLDSVRSALSEKAPATRLVLHTCEDLGKGCVTVMAYPEGSAPVQALKVRVLYKDGTEVIPEYGMPYPVVLDPMNPPDYVAVSGPWEDLCHITPPYLMRRANDHGGLRGISVELSDGRILKHVGHEVEEKLARQAVKALRKWLELERGTEQ